MSKRIRRILVATGDAGVAEQVAGWLDDGAYQVEICATLEAVRGKLRERSYGLVLCAEALPDGAGLELLDDRGRDLRGSGLILLADSVDPQAAAQAITRGAYGYLGSPLERDALQVAVSSAVERLRGVRELQEQAARASEALHADSRVLLTQLGELHRLEERRAALQKAVEILGAYFDVLQFQVLEYDPLTRHYAALIRSDDLLDGPLFAADDRELDFVVQQRRPALIPCEDERAAAFGEHGIHAVLHIPLATHTTLMGVLALYVGREEYSDRFAMEAAEHVGGALTGTLETIRLHSNLRAQSDLLDNIMESIPHGMLAIDLQDRIITLNRNAEMMFGIRRFLVLRENFRNVLPVELAAVFSSLSLLALKGSGSGNYELEHAIDERTKFTIGFSTSCIHDRDGNKAGVLYICRDLSLSREVEKLRELDLMKSEFVHTVSHELKTPLTAILGGTEILLSDDALDGEQREIVEIVDEGGKRLKNLITDLLDLSTLESGRVDLSEEQHLLSRVADETLDLLAGRGNCELVRDYQPGLDPILFDRAKMKQVMENLISNAIKYSPHGGTVTLRIRVTDDNHQQVEVADQGLGIPEGQLEAVFEKFFRVDCSSTAEIEGTGLGLSITRHIVEMHGGKIWVESTLGEGSTFIFKVPIRQESTHGF